MDTKLSFFYHRTVKVNKAYSISSQGAEIQNRGSAKHFG